MIPTKVACYDAKIPLGAYIGSCTEITVNSGELTATCYTGTVTNGIRDTKSSKITLSTCPSPKDIDNTSGDLTCRDQPATAPAGGFAAAYASNFNAQCDAACKVDFYIPQCSQISCTATSITAMCKKSDGTTEVSSKLTLPCAKSIGTAQDGALTCS